MITRGCISLNHKCNLQCRYCHFSGKEIAKTDEYEFTESEVTCIIENITKYCADNRIKKFKIGIVGSGEPLLSFDVMSHLVTSARHIGRDLFQMYTITNGVVLTNDHIDFFYKNKDIIELNFSLDGNAKVHNAMRQGYKKTMSAIMQYEKKFGEKPRINATVTRTSLERANEIINFFTTHLFYKINFSIICDINDPSISITEAEYEAFIKKCSSAGIDLRQQRNSIEKTYDCAKFGRLCGVGHNNIFFTRKGIYPCGRFFGLHEYKLTEFDAKLCAVQDSFKQFNSLSNGDCYYDIYIKE